MKITDFKNNVILLKGNIFRQLANLKNCKFRFEGTGNLVEIGGGARLSKGSFVILGSRTFVSIGEGSHICNFVIRADGIRSRILIEDNVYFGGGCIHAMGGSKIQIGRGGMISHDIDIRNGDGHHIYSADKDSKYKMSRDVIIGNHVWIGIRTQILKGVTIADDCIIGASSVVNKSFEESGCIIAGHPAKIIKRNIRWEK